MAQLSPSLFSQYFHDICTILGQYLHFTIKHFLIFAQYLKRCVCNICTLCVNVYNTFHNDSSHSCLMAFPEGLEAQSSHLTTILAEVPPKPKIKKTNYSVFLFLSNTKCFSSWFPLSYAINFSTIVTLSRIKYGLQ